MARLKEALAAAEEGERAAAAAAGECEKRARSHADVQQYELVRRGCARRPSLSLALLVLVPGGDGKVIPHRGTKLSPSLDAAGDRLYGGAEQAFAARLGLPAGEGGVCVPRGARAASPETARGISSKQLAQNCRLLSA